MLLWNCYSDDPLHDEHVIVFLGISNFRKRNQDGRKIQWMKGHDFPMDEKLRLQSCTLSKIFKSESKQTYQYILHIIYYGDKYLRLLDNESFETFLRALEYTIDMQLSFVFITKYLWHHFKNSNESIIIRSLLLIDIYYCMEEFRTWTSLLSHFVLQ